MFAAKQDQLRPSDRTGSAPWRSFTISIELRAEHHDAGGPAGIEAEANEFARAITAGG